MLTLTRRVRERIVIGGDVEIEIVDVGRGKVRVGIRAPRGVAIHRGEVLDRIAAENQVAAQASPGVAIDSTGAPTRVHFEAGLLGLRAHRDFDIYEVDGHPELRQLVSVADPMLRLSIVDAELVVDPTHAAEARSLAGESPDAIVALVVTVPRDGRPPSVNLHGPIVIDVASGRATQVVIEPSTSTPVRQVA